jgi:hypothetical protein
MKPTDYHGIALWDKQLGRKKRYTQKEQAHAAETHAPIDAVCSDAGGNWICVSDLAKNHPFRADYARYLEKHTMSVPFHYIRRLHELYPDIHEEPTFDLVVIDKDQKHRFSNNTWGSAGNCEEEFLQEQRDGFASLPQWGILSVSEQSRSTRPPPVPVSKLSTLRMAAGNEKKYSRVIMDKHVLLWVSLGWINERPAQPADFEVYPVVID